MSTVHDQLAEEEEVLYGVSRLQEELEVERAKNNGLTQKFEEMKVQYDNDNEITTELRKRIIKLENELAEGLSRSNSRRGGEEAMLSRLRTLLEQSEAARHQSEYALLLEEKKHRELTEDVARKEDQYKEEIKKYKGILTECQNRALDWEKAVELTQKAADLERNNLENTIKKMDAALGEKDSVIEFLNFEGNEKRKQLDDVSVALRDETVYHQETKSQLTKSQEILKEQKEAVKQHCLKQAVQDQRERKLKQELSDMKKELKGLENNLQKERGLSIQSTQQLSNFEEKFMLTDRENRELRNKLADLEERIENSTKRERDINLEVQEKQDVCNKLTDQLNQINKEKQIAEKELTQEIGRYKEQSSNLTKELHHHQTICADLAGELNSLQARMEQIDTQYGDCISILERVYCQHFRGNVASVTPTDMMKSLSQKLQDFSKSNSTLEREVETKNRDFEQIASQNEMQKKSLDAKTSTITSLQNQVSEILEQKTQHQYELKNLTGHNNNLQQQIQDMTQLLATEQEKTLTLLKDKKDNIEQHHDILKEHSEVVRQIGRELGSVPTDSDWNYICTNVLQSARKCAAAKRELESMLKESQEEVRSCHVAMETLSKNVDQARIESSRKLTESESVHSEHIKSLEDNYLKLIDTLNEKVKAAECNTHSTNDKVRNFYQENNELKEEIEALKESLETADKRRVNYQAAVGMLGSNVLHHMNCYNRVLYVLSIYKLQLKKAENKLKELTVLSDALVENKVALNPIFKFRRAVIAVLAVNRFKGHGVHFKHNYLLGAPDNLNPIQWLESEQLGKLITNCTKTWRTRPLSFTTDKLISTIYNNTDSIETEFYNGSLAKMLSAGLKHCSKQPYPVNNPVLQIRSFALNLTKRLHTVEVERRSLICKVNYWQKEAEQLTGAVQQTTILSNKVSELEGMVFKTVPLNKHEAVMKELATVMAREECLREESHNLRQQLKRLEESYEHNNNLLAERSDTLDEAIKDLSNQKILLRQNEQLQRSNTRKLASLESEKSSYYDQLQSVQKCLDSRSKERDALFKYLTQLQQHLEERKARSVQTSGNLGSVTGYLSSESAAENAQIHKVQKVCCLYEDVLKLATRRINTLERDVQSTKSHADSLKDELSAACQRLIIDDIPMGKPLVGRDSYIQRDEEFVTLQQCKSPTQLSELGARIGRNFSNEIENVL